MMLNQEARMGTLSYHHNCGKTKLTHLSFADDLLIFIDGSIEPVQRVLQILADEVSGGSDGQKEADPPQL